MIISNRANQSTSRWLQACGLLGTMLVLPLGIASAQDYEAVGKRLRGAVAAGELTGEQACAMLGALRRTAQPDERRADQRDRGERARGERDPRAMFEAAEKEIEAAIAAGKMTEEQGKEGLVGFKNV